MTFMFFIKTCKKAGPVLLVSLFLLLGCDRKSSAVYVKIAGSTMGTSYHITAKLPESAAQTAVEMAIANRLIEINQSMSTYIAKSEISQFNDAGINQPVSVGKDFLQVLLISQQVYEQSQAAFNPTIGPLVDLWGFGPRLMVESFQKKPAELDIQTKLQELDFTALHILGSQVTKSKPMRLDFSAVAKGYAVDEIARLLSHAGVQHYMVEIGGEVKTQGLSPRNSVWRIGIEQPNNIRGKTFRALALKDAAVATSGDYRNFLEIDGKRYSHTIDPTTGYPVDHNLSSITVITDTVAAADAWATAIMVLGESKGYAIAETHNLAVYMIYRENGEYAVKYTQSMQPYLSK